MCENFSSEMEMWASGPSGGIDLDSDELCLIDSGITHLAQIPLKPQLRSLNLHSNQVSQLDYLGHLRNLVHLDLSSNQINVIQGLDGLVTLRTLNLSCNIINKVQGLSNLRSLVKLNLSYNQIVDLSGFGAIQGREYRLSHVELHGNLIASVPHILDCMSGCLNLRHLMLSLAGADNPVCQKQGYRTSLLEGLSWLEVLDGVDRSGHRGTQHEVLADIPGLDQYIEFLVSSESSDINPLTVATPRIDAAMEHFRSQPVTTPEMSNTTITDQDTSLQDTPTKHVKRKPSNATKGSKKPSTDHELRLETLENQLANLLYGGQDRKSYASQVSRQMKSRVTKHPAKRDTDQTDESDLDSSSLSRVRRKTERGASKTTRKAPAKKASRSPGRSSSGKKNEDHKHGKDASISRSSESLVVHGHSSSFSASELTPRKTPPGSRVLRPDQGPTAIAADEQGRDDVRSTYLSLMSELETERERRWKAEQAAKKLAEHIQVLQSKANEGQEIQDVAVQATTRLKQALTNEREVRTQLEAKIEQLKDEVKKLQGHTEESQNAEDAQRRALQAMEATATKREREHLQQQAHDAKRLQEAQMRASAAAREVELLRSNVKSLQGKITQLQELLAAREQEHRKEMEGKFPLLSKEVMEHVQKETARLEKAHAEELRLAQTKVDNVMKQYHELEDEFRMALQIESNRFTELKAAFERTSREGAENKQAVMNLQKKDEKSTSIISELTALVKEQKGRITELSRAKQEQTAELKDRIQTLELHLEEARKRMVQLELMKQERTKLQSQVQAQESIIEGLKSERKLWGEELAHQGASLAQDRGRLEAKIETLTSEVTSCKRQLEKEADTVKIKTKMIEDQTESIRKLKEGLVERDEEIKRCRDDALGIQRDLEEQLRSEQAANQDLQERLDRARERKEELKSQVVDLEEQLETSKRAHSVLNGKWKEKSNLIGELERQVGGMKSAWDAKEQKLNQERDKAINAASMAIDKMKAMDASFRQQLDAKERTHQEALERLSEEKQQEIQLANQRVIEVEEEMRELLRETDASKRAMEERVKRLNSAFRDLQQELH